MLNLRVVVVRLLVLDLNNKIYNKILFFKIKVFSFMLNYTAFTVLMN